MHLWLPDPEMNLDTVDAGKGETIGYIIAASYKGVTGMKPNAGLGDTNSCLFTFYRPAPFAYTFTPGHF